MSEISNFIISAKKERKEYYKQKAKDALKENPIPQTAPHPTSLPPTPRTNSFAVTPRFSEQAAPPQTESFDLSETILNVSDQNLDSTKSSFTFMEITNALKDSLPNSNTIGKNFIDNMTEHSINNSIIPQFYSKHEINFYFKHLADPSAALIPGFSYGRGSIPPVGYRFIRFAEKSTQTDTNFDESNYRTFSYQASTKYLSPFLCTSSTNTDNMYTSKPCLEDRRRLGHAVESPIPNSTTDDDVDSGSSCTSSNYFSSASKTSRNKGRGRGRGKLVPTVGALKSTDSDSETRKGRGRGRGAAGSTEDQIGASNM